MAKISKNIFLILVLSSFISIYHVSSQNVNETEITLQSLQCLRVPSIRKFNLKRFQGIWYDKASFQNILPQLDCLRLTIQEQKSSNFVANFNGVEPVNTKFSGSSKIQSFPISFTIPDAKMSNKLRLLLNKPNLPFIDFFIMDTDYKNFAVAYACSRGIPNIWILSRKRDLAPVIINQIKKNIENKFFMDLSRLPDKKQTNCPA